MKRNESVYKVKRKYMKKVVVILVSVLLLTILIPGQTFAYEKGSDSGLSTMQKMKEALPNRPENNFLEGSMPCRGNAKLLVINLELESQRNEMSTEEIQAMMFGDRCSYGSDVRDENITDYFESVSYGKLHVTGNVVPYQVKDMPKSTNEAGNFEELKAILDEVLAEQELSQYDQNKDGYFDGIVFLYPDQVTNERGSAPFWEYEYEGLKSVEMVCVESKYCKDNNTVEHELIHLMGVPDMYANVWTNYSGTYSDTIMGDGLGASWNRDNGYISANVPGVIKFLYGWLDNVVEVSDSGVYTLKSFSANSEAMVIYPRGNQNSKFIYFVEYLNLQNNERIFANDVFFGEGGLRIWRIHLSLDDEYQILGNEGGKGCGSSPYTFIEAIHFGEDHFILRDGESLDFDQFENCMYATEYELLYYYNPEKVYTYQACCEKNRLLSGISLSNVTQNKENDSVEVTIDIRQDILKEPQGITATKEGDIARIKWNKVDDATGYYVMRRIQSDTYVEYTTIATIEGADSCSFLDNNIKAETQYLYTVRAFNQEQKSGYNVGVLLTEAKSFADISETSWQYTSAKYAYDNGLMAGKGQDENGNIIFDPNKAIPREEFVQVLYNASGKPAVSIENKFPDVKDAWYKNAVLWANANDIANGKGNGDFGVTESISRQDLALMLYKYARLNGYDLTANNGEINKYADGAKVSSYAKTAMDWAITKGVMSGKGNKGEDISTFKLDPTGTATRAECAAMLKNFMEAYGK